MELHRIGARVAKGGTITVTGLHVTESEEVEVIVLRKGDKYPLRNTPYRFDDPFEPVGVDWETTK